MTNTIKTVLATIGGLIIILAVIGAMSAPKQEKPNTIMRDNFINGCMQSSTQSECSCMYDKLLAYYGQDGLIQIGLDYQNSSTLPPHAYSIALECSN